MTTPKSVWVSWALQILSALIMLQTLFFKFTASEESVYIFSTLNMEPAGRIGIGMVELISSVLLLIPSLCWIGALLGLGLMAGAIFFHLTSLGIEVMDDGGYLFILALIVFLSSLSILFIRRDQIPFLKNYLK